TALESLFELTGAEIEEVVRVYIYPSSDEMQTATLFAPDWSGGTAFAEYRTVLAGVSPDNLSWGREVVAHELTHVLIGVYTFSCVSDVPIWLNEGLAMYAETSVGTSHDNEYARLDEAVENNTLLTVREVSNLFSNDPDLARLSYAQSLSLVQFLIEEYGQENMLAFFGAFKEGDSQDQALNQVYGLDQDSLNDAWREWIGAAPMESASAPKATATRTPYPTIPPIGASEAATSVPDPVEPSATPEPTATLLKPVSEDALEPGRANFPVYILGGIVLAVILIASFVLILRNRSAK
ncbi:MAG: peptidase MA family metallohydrolase, partial [Anaerolineales bacterium]